MRTNQGNNRPSRARSGRRLALPALLATTALVIALSAAISPAAAHSAVRGSSAAGSAAQAAGTSHTVSFDGYSFMIDGQRTYIWSGEFHYFRLPSPDLWLDIFQKMKAAGFNATILMSNHTEFDSAIPKIKALAARRGGETHPYDVGKDAVQRYFKVTEECAQAQRIKLAQRAAKPN